MSTSAVSLPVRRRWPRAALLAGALFLGIAVAPPPVKAIDGLNVVVFNYTGATQTWSIPSGVESVRVSMAGGAGAQGSGAAQLSPTLNGTLTIPTGASTLDVNVGGDGNSFMVPSSPGAGGWNGGGNGGTHSTQYLAGNGGGGATDVRPGGGSAATALMVAGGTGGDGGSASVASLNGGSGGLGGLRPSAGATGGADDGGDGGAAGTLAGGAGGNGESTTTGTDGAGGGGGGGWLGGGGGAAGTAWSVSLRTGGGGGGGGGLSYADPSAVVGVTEGAAASAFVAISYLTMTSPNPTSATVGDPLWWQYEAGGDAIFTLASGTLPPGLSLDGNSGRIQGTPTTAGVYTFAIGASVYPDGANPVTTTS